MQSSARAKRISREDNLDLIFRALGDRTRRALLTELSHGPAMITELAKPFKMSLPAVSRHLRVLEKAQLVVRQIDGRVHRCSLEISPFQDIESWLSYYRPFWENALESLARYSEQRQPKDRK
jgi:DNA-binding transcriptional ArsR family regulator